VVRRLCCSSVQICSESDSLLWWVAWVLTRFFLSASDQTGALATQCELSIDVALGPNLIRTEHFCKILGLKKTGVIQITGREVIYDRGARPRRMVVACQRVAFSQRIVRKSIACASCGPAWRCSWRRSGSTLFWSFCLISCQGYVPLKTTKTLNNRDTAQTLKLSHDHGRARSGLSFYE
jgi:hypothetical protein